MKNEDEIKWEFVNEESDLIENHRKEKDWSVRESDHYRIDEEIEFDQQMMEDRLYRSDRNQFLILIENLDDIFDNIEEQVYENDD